MITINGHTYTSGYTHGGKYHADDICAAALLRLLDPVFPIIRGFNPPMDDDSVLVFDIGGGEYDHHSEPKELRENGTPYAAFGKLWRALADQFGLTEIQQEIFDRNICCPVDYTDNTGRQNPFSELLGSTNPYWDESPSCGDSLFFAAVTMTQQLFSRWFGKYKAAARAEKLGEQLSAAAEEGVAVNEFYIPTSNFGENVKFFVHPSQRGGWQALSIRHGFDQILFPVQWRGRKDLPEGITFCHTGGFIACFTSKERAIEICKSLVIADEVESRESEKEA